MKTTKQLVKFDFDLAIITALDAKYKGIQITDGKSYAVVMQGLAEYRELRLAIDDKHKELKRDILEAGRGLDGDKNRLKALLEPGENHLKEIRQAEDDRKAKIKEEKDYKERERIEAIQEKINNIRDLGRMLPNVSALVIEERLIIVKAMNISEKIYQESIDHAHEARGKAMGMLQEALTERLQTEKEDAERKAEAEHLEAQRKEQAEAQAKIDEEKREIEENRKKFEETERKAKLKKEQEEFERQAKEKAEAAAAQKLKDTASAEEERAKTAAAEKARQEALRPDKERLIIWIQNFNETALPSPTLKSKEAKEILRIARESIEEVLQAAIWKTEKL